jgi:hypothetical protein
MACEFRAVRVRIYWASVRLDIAGRIPTSPSIPSARSNSSSRAGVEARPVQLDLPRFVSSPTVDAEHRDPGA